MWRGVVDQSADLGHALPLEWSHISVNGLAVALHGSDPSNTLGDGVGELARLPIDRSNR